MGKRSRDASFSPSGDEHISNTKRSTADPEDVRVSKLAVYEGPKQSYARHVMQCSLPPHPGSLEFPTMEEFEVHYTKEHTNRCSECGRNMPSGHFLNLHLDENHNPVREALAAKGEKTYACFLPECEKKCSTQQKRRMHMIDKHHFPKVYNFHVVNTGIDNTNTLLQESRRRRVSLTNDQSLVHRQRGLNVSKTATQDNSAAIPEKLSAIHDKSELADSDNPAARLTRTDRPADASSAAVDDIKDLERSLAALNFVPRSVVLKHGSANLDV